MRAAPRAGALARAPSTSRLSPASRAPSRPVPPPAARRRSRASSHVARGLAVEETDARVVDFYEILGVSDDADVATIKRAYYDLAMYCHPDRSGDEGNDLCVLLNEAYAILKDPDAREQYDAELAVQREDDDDLFTGQAYSKWTTRKAAPGETRAVFVDEFTCIGCKQCVWAAPATFRMDDDHGRSRVFAQWLDAEDDIECAMASCPVDCIHWVQRQQLPYLEHVTRFVDKVSVGIMQSGQGRQSVTDPFDAAVAYEKFRERKIERRRQKLEEERLTREYRRAKAEEEAERAANKQRGAAGEEASRKGGGGSGGGRRATRGRGDAARKIAEAWASGAGVALERARRRRWVDGGATVPIERALVPVSRGAVERTPKPGVEAGSR